MNIDKMRVRYSKKSKGFVHNYFFELFQVGYDITQSCVDNDVIHK